MGGRESAVGGLAVVAMASRALVPAGLLIAQQLHERGEHLGQHRDRCFRVGVYNAKQGILCGQGDPLLPVAHKWEEGEDEIALGEL